MIKMSFYEMNAQQRALYYFGSWIDSFSRFFQPINWRKMGMALFILLYIATFATVIILLSLALLNTYQAIFYPPYWDELMQIILI